MPLSQEKLISSYIEGAAVQTSTVWTDIACDKYPTTNAETLVVAALGGSAPLQEWADNSEVASTNLAEYKNQVVVTDYNAQIPMGLSAVNANPELWYGVARREGAKINQKIRAKITAFINGNQKALDGVALYSTSHVIGNQAAQSNLVSATEIPAANLNLTDPTAQSMAEVVMQTKAYMQAFRDEHGQIKNPDIKHLVVVANSALNYNALLSAITVTTFAGQITNPLAVLVASGAFKVSVFLDTELAASNCLWFFIGDEGNRPIILGADEPVDMSIMDPNSEHAKKRKALLFQLLVKLAIAGGDWANTCRVTLS